MTNMWYGYMLWTRDVWFRYRKYKNPHAWSYEFVICMSSFPVSSYVFVSNILKSSNAGKNIRGPLRIAELRSVLVCVDFDPKLVALSTPYHRKIRVAAEAGSALAQRGVEARAIHLQDQLHMEVPTVELCELKTGCGISKFSKWRCVIINCWQNTKR